MQKTINVPPQGNKWGEEMVIEMLIDIERDALETDVLFLGRSLTKMGLYPQLWSYWRKVYSHNEDIMARMMRINCIFECKLCEGALRKQLSPYMALSALKRNHHWNEPPEPDDMGSSSSPTYIRMDADTLKVVGTAENADIYVKVKEQDKNIHPESEPEQCPTHLPEVKEEISQAATSEKVCVEEINKPAEGEKGQPQNATPEMPDILQYFSQGPDHSIDRKFPPALPQREGPDSLPDILQENGEDTTREMPARDPVPEVQNKISYTFHY